jgi:indolepyruvate ferredoxin oxidoreductase beta subunit
VGGQGVLLASELLVSAAVEVGYDAKKSEVHGMAQRGGIVYSHIRIGEKVYSPLIKEGCADVILAFEQAEAMRWIHFLDENGTIIINRFKLIPPIASMKGYEYPEDPIGVVKKRAKNVKVIDAISIAKELWNPRLMNTVLLGLMSASLDIPIDVWEKVIRKRVPQGTEDFNVKAFFEGRQHK